MPESTQFTYTHKEIVELLVKKAGLKEGKWQLVVTFGFGAANLGPDDKNLSPAGMVAVTNIGIQRVPDPNQSITNMMVDASELS